jgi:hypothetical protein
VSKDHEHTIGKHIRFTRCAVSTRTQGRGHATITTAHLNPSPCNQTRNPQSPASHTFSHERGVGVVEGGTAEATLEESHVISKLNHTENQREGGGGDRRGEAQKEGYTVHNCDSEIYPRLVCGRTLPYVSLSNENPIRNQFPGPRSNLFAGLTRRSFHAARAEPLDQQSMYAADACVRAFVSVFSIHRHNCVCVCVFVCVWISYIHTLTQPSRRLSQSASARATGDRCLLDFPASFLSSLFSLFFDAAAAGTAFFCCAFRV